MTVMKSIKRIRGLVGLVGVGLAAAGALSDLRDASRRRDKLALVNAVAGVIAALTGAALAVRSLRRGDDGDSDGGSAETVAVGASAGGTQE